MLKLASLFVTALFMFPFAAKANTYWLVCDGETVLWSTRSNEHMKYADQKKFKIVDGEIDKMDCTTNKSKTRLICITDIPNTNLPTIKAIKTMIELDLKTNRVTYLHESKVSAAEVLQITPELKEKIGNAKYVVNESRFTGNCRKRK